MLKLLEKHFLHGLARFLMRTEDSLGLLILMNFRAVPTRSITKDIREQIPFIIKS